MRISICIPQYNRCRYLLQGLESIRAQTYRDVEVVVSDDGSKDDSPTVIPEYLARSGMAHRFIQQPRNLGYDANLRAALAAATGDYLFIMGNDDILPAVDTLARVAVLLEKHRPAVALGNVQTAGSQTVSKRVLSTRLHPGSVDTAIAMFRAFSCVTGVIFRRESFQEHNTSRYDGSVYVQMFLGSRVVASGGPLLAIDEVIATTSISVDGALANNYGDTLGAYRWRFRPVSSGLDEVGRVVYEAISPYAGRTVVDDVRLRAAIFGQILAYSYPYWLHDFRSKGHPWAALNFALGCNPNRLMRGVRPGAAATAAVWPVYLGATFAGLVLPVNLAGALKDVVRGFAMRSR